MQTSNQKYRIFNMEPVHHRMIFDMARPLDAGLNFASRLHKYYMLPTKVEVGRLPWLTRELFSLVNSSSSLRLLKGSTGTNTIGGRPTPPKLERPPSLVALETRSIAPFLLVPCSPQNFVGFTMNVNFPSEPSLVPLSGSYFPCPWYRDVTLY